MPIKITVEESDKTSLQTPKGKEEPNDKTSLQTPQGKEVEELPAMEPLAIPDDDELKPVDTIVIKDGETYKNVKVYEVMKQAKEQEGAKCQFCKGTGKVIVEKKGIKECPRCEGEGYTSKPQAELEGVKDDQQIDDITQEEEIQGGIQPETEEQIEQGMDEFQQEKPMEEPMEQKLIDQEPIEEEVEVPEKENVKAFESFVSKKIQVLQQKHPDKAVTLLMGTEMNGDYGSKKIKGTLAYAGVSLNDRIYLPEELAKGDGMTLPLLLNHSSTAGAEGELYRLQDDARQSLERGQDYRVGEVTLTWKPEDLTLYYEGEVENKFFQKEVDEADMAVSLGIYYDSDSPMLCNDQCYTVIKGAEFREVSLVYHAGFPVATIEAYEKLLKNKAMESMKGEPNINPEKANEWNAKTDEWNEDEWALQEEKRRKLIQVLNNALDMNLKKQEDYREWAEKEGLGYPDTNNPDLIKERDNLLKQRKKVMAGTNDYKFDGISESKANEDDDEYYEYDDDGTQLNPVEYDDDEYIDDSDVPRSGNYESKATEGTHKENMNELQQYINDYNIRNDTNFTAGIDGSSGYSFFVKDQTSNMYGKKVTAKTVYQLIQKMERFIRFYDGESKASEREVDMKHKKWAKQMLEDAEKDSVCPICGEKSPYVRMGDFWETHFEDKHGYKFKGYWKGGKLVEESKEGLGRDDHYGQDGYCPICDWKTIEPDWKTDLEYHLATGHGINGAEIVDIMRRAFESMANEYEKYTNNWWRNRKCQSCGKVLGDDWEKTPEAKTGDPLAGFRCEDCVDRLEDYRATYDPKFEAQ